jgi:hypothetical protein
MKPELEFHTPDADWVAGGGGVAGIWSKILSQDEASGAHTGLIRFEAGVDTSPIGTRCHDYWEEVYILEGDLSDTRLGLTFSAGMYACRPPGMLHGPWRTESGVLMLEIRYGRSA